MILDRARQSPQAIAFREKRNGAYADVPWSEVLPRIENIALGLLSAAHLSDGARVSIAGNTSLDWILVDIAAMSAGLQTVPIYTSLLPEEIAAMHAETRVELIVAENKEQLAKMRAIGKQMVIVVDPAGIDPADDWESLAAVETRGRERRTDLMPELERRNRLIRREDIATFSYTSGTTGLPKAVIQTHHNLLSMLENTKEDGLFSNRSRDAGLMLFLPLANAFGRFIALAGPFAGAPLVLSTVPTLPVDLGLARPGFFPGAPRIYEKMAAKLLTIVASLPPMKKRLFQWAIDVGKKTVPYVITGKPLPLSLRLEHALADKLVLSKVRAKIGMDRIAVLLSGSAPLRADVHELFLALGLLLIESYGMTEGCPGLTTNRPGAIRFGTVGQAFKGVTIHISGDGEILAKGPNITCGYVNRPEAMADAFDGEGWFHTGDLGTIDGEGFVRITGRKKELIKTNSGELIAPVKIEARLKTLPFIQEAMVIGENRGFCTCLFALDPDNLKDWSKREGFSHDPASPQVHRVLEKHVQEVNGSLPAHESIKSFRVLDAPMTIDGGELTTSLKVRRSVVQEKYRALIEEMYAG
jgi:long-chain acyl-CoA synthetase